MQQIVLPIKDSNVLKEVQDTLLHNFKAGQRNYTIFQVGKATLLRVSDVMCLKQTDIFNPDGSIKKMRSFTIEKLVSLIPCTLNQLKQTFYCIVNGCLITNYNPIGSFLRFNTQSDISQKNSSTKS